MIKAVIFDMFETLITHYSQDLYFGEQIAADIGIAKEEFLPKWNPMEGERFVGKWTLEELLERIMREQGCYREEVFRRVVEKRVATKYECFKHLNPEILPMLEAIRESGKKIGLISNCFSEEIAPIRESVIATYLDCICLSYELGLMKPDPAIFSRCTESLGVSPEECLYIGDGGSRELETARSLGMTALQAGWYLEQSGRLNENLKSDFPLLHTPMDVLGYIK